MKKIFEKVRQWTKKQIPDKDIEAVLNALSKSDVYYPSDFTISFTKEQKESAKKANEELNEKTKSLFYEIDHEIWGDGIVEENVATIIFGLVLSANGDTLEKEVKNKIKIIPFDIKGGKEDIDFVKGIEYPISLKRVQDIKAYLDTKVTHPFPEVMFEDIRHTKKFTDVPWGVLTHIVSYYHAYNGDVTAKDMLGYVKRKMLKEVPLNKRGANIKGGGHTYDNRGDWKMMLQNSDALTIGVGGESKVVIGKIIYKKEGEHLVAYLGSMKIGYWDYGLNEGYIYHDKFKNGANVPENTEVTTKQFNIYFQKNYGFISHNLSTKEVEKFLNQDVIKRVSLPKKADYFQDYLLANGLADDVQLKKGSKIPQFEKLPKNRQANKKYAYFAVGKADGKIVDGWEIVYDVQSLKESAPNDLRDNDYNPKDFRILSKETIIRTMGINPFDYDNWRKVDYTTNESVIQTKFLGQDKAKDGANIKGGKKNSKKSTYGKWISVYKTDANELGYTEKTYVNIGDKVEIKLKNGKTFKGKVTKTNPLAISNKVVHVTDFNVQEIEKFDKGGSVENKFNYSIGGL